MTSQKEYFDLIILGAGITGLSIARQQLLSNSDAKVLILEKERAVGLHASGRNSGVLHSGIYYPSETLKAKFCSHGARLMSNYCLENNLPLHKCGKVILPINREDDTQIDLLNKRSKLNGALTQIISGSELKKIEPEAYSISSKALYSPNTSVVDPIAVLKSLISELINQGMTISYEEYVISADPDNSSLLTNKGKAYKYGQLINSTGQYSDVVAKRFGIGGDYTMVPFKGIYYKLADFSNIKLNGLIYPVPDLRIPFLGIHSVKLINGETYFGPNSIPALGRENYNNFQSINIMDTLSSSYHLLSQYISNKDEFRLFAHRELQTILKSRFFKKIKYMIPNLTIDDLVKSNKVGIRAQLYNKRKSKFEMDFLVETKGNSKHILNAVSPAFTSSFAFAKYILNK